MLHKHSKDTMAPGAPQRERNGMKLRGKAKQRARRKARGPEPRMPDSEVFSYTAKAWEPLPPDMPDETKRVWALIKPKGAPPVDFRAPAPPLAPEEGR
jgi:hypothetical protein